MPWAEELPWNKARTVWLRRKRKLILPIHPTCKERLGCPQLTSAPAGSDVRARLRADSPCTYAQTHTHTHTPFPSRTPNLWGAAGWALLPILPLAQGRCPSRSRGQEGGEGCAASCMAICLDTSPRPDAFANLLRGASSPPLAVVPTDPCPAAGPSKALLSPRRGQGWSLGGCGDPQ